MIKKRLLAGPAVLVVVAMASLGATATPASAATHAAKPAASSGCSGDANITLSTPSGGRFNITAGVPTSILCNGHKFYGHFEIAGTNTGLIGNSANETWLPGPDYEITGIPAVVEQYCVTAWAHNSTTGKNTNIGKACENVT